VFFGWSEEDKKFYNTLINCCAVIGLIVGSLIGGEIIVKGRRRANIIIQTIAILASILTLFKSIPLICIGRFLIGAVACTSTIIMGKSISETLPAHLSAQYGILTNISINFGVFVSFLLGLLLPTNPEDFATDEVWKVISAMSAFSGFLSIILWETVFTEEPVAFCIANDREEEAVRLLKRVYIAVEEVH